ncbi:MAG: S9 family peptidase, partial [Acidobacteria bacterium]|nr:S9 family peptidase [Acidobacteriota bacterium]
MINLEPVLKSLTENAVEFVIVGGVAITAHGSAYLKLMKKTFRFLPFYFYLFTFAFCLSAVSQTLTVREIMREPSIAGMRPDNERLSPDGRLVAFSWNAEGNEPRNLYLTSTSVSETRKIVDAEENYEMRTPAPESQLNYGLTVRDEFSKAREKNLGGAEFSPNSKRLLFTQNSDIYVLEIGNTVTPLAVLKPRRITRTQGTESAARWLDDETILYQSGGNFFALNIEKTFLVQLTKEANPAVFVSVSFATPTEDAKLLAYAVSDGSKQRALFVPNYLDEFVQSPTFRRGFTEQKVFVTKTDGSLEKSFEINLPKAEGAAYVRSVKWAADNASLIVDRVDKDTKRRQLFYIHNVGSKAEQTILITEETDEKWIGSLSRIVEPNPKNNSQILFASEKDGFNHLYLAMLERAKPQPNPTGEIRQENPTDARFSSTVSIKQLTSGNFEVDWAKWIADGKQIIFSSTENNTATRDFFVFDFETTEKYPAFKNFALTSENNKTTVSPSFQNGMKTNPQIDKENSQPIFLYEFSRWNSPTELFIYPRICPRCGRVFQPLQITKSTTEKFKQTKWSEPQFFSFKAKDGKKIPAKIYLPNAFDKSKKYPMVIFVHGAGYLQNVINGWNNYYREFMFHTLLTQKGYVVLDVDYRGSAGYGRDFRTDVYDFLGGLDYQDHLDAIDFAVKNYAVNEKRIGVYGGSYGGFMAEMLVMRAPERIAAAAALRPVGDWKNYFYSSPLYTTERLGFPDKNPEAYKRSSPIS